jgi:HEAT repeat protein
VFVKSVQPDASGGVQIAVDETRRRLVSGRLDDQKIQRLLLAAMRDETNPGVRVESMEILKNRSDSREVRAALLQALLHDQNPGVRLTALEGLKRFGTDAEIRKTLARVLLTDDNPGMRIQAIDVLTAQRDDSIVGMLQTLVRKEDNNYVRMRIQNALREMNASIGTF